ncbi:hypothetical protein PQO03_13535 [Lentisphaera profundi]|uniref:DUF5666 domain-containing protein n=1 Tax=Lentisphaera profundi TaxID=1658616 RepID=A0ABY7VYR1_9BACT|nr:hypothetical protein [Lentisphaera profundi]WDE98857.1 hypothetical protein PQO03_13535 [Lentisphaera profundi]
MKKLITILLVLLIASPIMAKEKKAKALKGKVVSITAEAATFKIKKDEKQYKVTADTKILDKDGAAVAPADVKFKMASIKTDPADATTLIEIKELAKKAKAPKKKKEE